MSTGVTRNVIFASAALLLIAAVISVFVCVKHRNEGDAVAIGIGSLPYRTDYYAGENADFDGLTVTIKEAGGQNRTVSPEECDISGFDSSVSPDPGKPVTQNVRVTFEGLTTSFRIRIFHPPVPADSAGVK